MRRIAFFLESTIHSGKNKLDCTPKPPRRGTAVPKLASKLLLARAGRGGSGESRAPEFPARLMQPTVQPLYCHIPTPNSVLLVLLCLLVAAYAPLSPPPSQSSPPSHSHCPILGPGDMGLTELQLRPPGPNRCGDCQYRTCNPMSAAAGAYTSLRINLLPFHSGVPSSPGSLSDIRLLPTGSASPPEAQEASPPSPPPTGIDWRLEPPPSPPLTIGPCRRDLAGAAESPCF